MPKLDKQRMKQTLIGLGVYKPARQVYGGHPRFTLVPKAVASAVGTARMRIARTSLLSSLRQDWYPDCVAEIDVELTTLDALIDTFGTPRFCKIDIEGYELEALRGLSRRVEYMSLEYNSGHPDLTFACIDELARLGTLELNYSRMEALTMASDQWMGRDEFVARLQAELKTQPETYWGGDVFLHVNPPVAVD